jgi:hypothetical protein
MHSIKPIFIYHSTIFITERYDKINLNFYYYSFVHFPFFLTLSFLHSGGGRCLAFPLIALLAPLMEIIQQIQAIT